MKFTGERFIPSEALLKDEIGYEHLHRYHAAIALVKDKAVLDIACGEGYGSAIMCAHAASVVGVDIDEECIKWATEQYAVKHYNLQFRYGSAGEIPSANHVYDVVISFETIEHLTPATQDRFMLEIKRVLRPGGILIMSTPDKKNYSERYVNENSFHLHEFYREEYIDFIEKNFGYFSIFDQGYEVVNIISNAETERGDSIRLYHRQNDNDKNGIVRKYIIAVASDTMLPEQLSSFASVIPRTDKDYLSLMDRLIVMNKEIENLGVWGTALDKSLQEARLHASHYIREIAEAVAQNKLLAKSLEDKDALLSEAGTSLAKLETERAASIEKTISLGQLLQQQSNLLQSLDEDKTKLLEETAHWRQKFEEKQFLADELSEKLHRLYQEANASKERLTEIYDSDGWRLLSVYYRLKGKIFPEHSIRYKKAKKIFNGLRFKRTEKDHHQADAGIEKISTLFSEETAAVTFDILTLPVYAHPAVSIIIPAYNAWKMNYQCIESIITNTQGIGYEVILADDCSVDGTKDCTGTIKNLIHIRNGTNTGFLKNCNNAARHAKGKYILFLNNDTRVHPVWLSPLVNLIESNETIGMVGSKLIYADGRLQEAGGIIWEDASAWNYGHGQNPALPAFNYVREVDYISGASLMIRSQLWKQIGGFDTAYSPAYCEDSDLAFEVRKKGFKVMYQPLSEVIHYEGYSHGSDTHKSSISAIKDYQGVNNQKFLQKWKLVLKRDHFRNGENIFWAKDRSRYKKTLLMVDHYVPQFDKDAGSRTTFQYLELFIQLGFNVKFLGANFYKHEPYTTILQQMGIEVLYGAWYADNWQDWFRENGEKFDYIYLNRPHIAINFIDFFKQASNAKIIYYGHDLHFLREEKKYELEKDTAILTEASKWKEIELSLFGKSDIILTASTDEQNVIRSINPDFNVQLMRPYLYRFFKEPVTTFHHRHDLLFVGGFGHLPNVDGVLWFVREVWPLIKQQAPLVKFIVAGSNPPAEISQLSANRDITVKGYVADDELQKLYGSCKLAIIPLRYGAGVKGKTVEAMYFGMPMVTTSFGVEGLPGNYSFLKAVDTAAEFAREVVELYSDEEQLKEQSKKSVAYIQNTFSAEVAGRMISDILETVKGDGGEQRT